MSNWWSDEGVFLSFRVLEYGLNLVDRTPPKSPPIDGINHPQIVGWFPTLHSIVIVDTHGKIISLRVRVEAEMRKMIPLSEECLDELEVTYLRTAISLQQKLRARAFERGISIEEPQQFDKSSGRKLSRSHWASSCKSWAQLTEEEREAAESIDFTVSANPTNWFEAASISMSDRSVLNPRPKQGEIGRRTLEILESLRCAPRVCLKTSYTLKWFFLIGKHLIYQWI